MSQYNAQKNPPWARSNDFGNSSQNMPQTMMSQSINPAVLQYPQSAVPNNQPAMYQAQLAMQQQALSMQQFVANSTQQLYNSQVGGMGNNARVAAAMMPGNMLMSQQQSQVGSGHQQSQQQQQPSSLAGGGAPSKQRVFTGTVTKVVDSYGFVDEDVFFQMSCVKGPHPVLHDRVLVEAVCLPTMPFKWNATRVQVLPMTEPSSGGGGGGRKRPMSREERDRSSYSAVPPPSEFDARRERERDRERDRRSNPKESDAEVEERLRRRRERRDREEKEKEKERESRGRSRTRSPPRRRVLTAQRKYRVRIPECPLDVKLHNVGLVKSRYPQMYIPSDFFLAVARWADTAPNLHPLSIAGPSRFHIMDKDVDPVFQHSDVVEPPDADFLYSAKVMLLSIPNKEDMYKKCIQLSEDKENPRLLHPSRLVECLVGLNTRSKNEYMAIGGPWSPSLDGADPVGDPSVLIKTAIRTCRALTGIDLTNVTRWYRFVEMHYHRGKTTHKGKEVPARVETVVMYAPDVWSVMPSGLEWDGLHLNYQKAAAQLLAGTADGAPAAAEDGTTAEDEKEDVAVSVKEPTHWSKIDFKTIKVSELREECVARGMSPKGLRLQLLARLQKVVKTEQEAEEVEKAKQKEAEKTERKEEEKKREKEDKEKEKEKESKQKDKAALADKYKLPDTPHIIVHSCKKAKSGKFGCKVINLSLLLDYTQDINKEHSFEVALFAENFNEMLMRDFGIQIYKALADAPEKVEEKKEDKKDEKEGEKKEDENAKDEEKKVDKEDGGDKKRKLEKEDSEEKRKEEDKKEDKKEVNGKDDEEEKKLRKKRERKREKYRTIRPELLLAFSYFDVTHFGKIANSDLEELIQTLGLDLARSQVKKLVTKVASDSYINYRKLTDEVIVEDEEGNEVAGQPDGGEVASPSEPAAPCEQGNRPLLPAFVLTPPTPEAKKTASTPKRGTRKGMKEEEKVAEPVSPPGFVSYNGALLNVSNLQEQVAKNEAARLRAEEKAIELKREVGELKDKLEHVKSDLRSNRRELSGSQKKMEILNDRFNKELISSDVYLTTLMDIHERLVPILDTDEIKRLVNLRQFLVGAPTINLVPLTKVCDIVVDHDDKNIKEEPMDVDVKSNSKSSSSVKKGKKEEKSDVKRKEVSPRRDTKKEESPKKDIKKEESPKTETKTEESQKNDSKKDAKKEESAKDSRTDAKK